MDTTKEEFIERIRTNAPADLAREFLMSETAHLFPDALAYDAFKAKISSMIASVQHISVVGSGNWRYSLNPEKNLREFCDKSDVDVAIISAERFNDLWEEMRLHHRKHFYTLPFVEKSRLRRNGENVYAGFISPEWIPNRERYRRYQYRSMLNTLSDHTVQYLKVRMLFFKNEVEAIDYYARGFQMAKEGFE